MSDEPLEEDRADVEFLQRAAHSIAGLEDLHDFGEEAKNTGASRVLKIAARLRSLSAAHRRCEATLERWELCPPDRTRALTELTLSIVDDVRAALAPATGEAQP